MANVWRRGFLVDEDTDALVVTTSTTGAAWRNGFVRSSAGALVVVSS